MKYESDEQSLIAESVYTANDLANDSKAFRHTAGVSENNADAGFLPAFIDKNTGIVYLSRTSNGQLAPMHLLEGLPSYLIVARNAKGKAIAVNGTVESGFYKQGFYYSRAAANAAISGSAEPYDCTVAKVVY